jgi:hypothetical protein
VLRSGAVMILCDITDFDVQDLAALIRYLSECWFSALFAALNERDGDDPF